MIKFGKSKKIGLSDLGYWSIQFWQFLNWIKEEGQTRKFEDSSICVKELCPTGYKYIGHG
jgi:hypothetical protein